MAADVKFCGLTREQDAAMAAELGATHIGVIFAGGPRHLTEERAREVLDAGGAGVRRVGVVGSQSLDEIYTLVRSCSLDVVQLHANPTSAQIEIVRDHVGAEVWAVVRVRGDVVPDTFATLASVADAIVLEAHHPVQLGGAGVSFDWRRAALAVEEGRGDARLVLAGGLTPANVALALGEIPASVVDVSSGVESAPGCKDHQRMRDFVAAVRDSPSAP